MIPVFIGLMNRMGRTDSLQGYTGQSKRLTRIDWNDAGIVYAKLLQISYTACRDDKTGIGISCCNPSDGIWSQVVRVIVCAYDVICLHLFRRKWCGIQEVRISVRTVVLC